MQLANNPSVATYLCNVPSEVLDTVNVSLRLGSVDLPIHKYLLITSSSVFRDVLAESREVLGSSVQTVQLLGDDAAGVMDALQFLYQRSCNMTAALSVTNVRQVHQCVNFAGKYDIPVLIYSCDEYLMDWVSSQKVTSQKQLKSLAAFATKHRLQNSMAVCEEARIINERDRLIQEIGQMLQRQNQGNSIENVLESVECNVNIE